MLRPRPPRRFDGLYHVEKCWSKPLGAKAKDKEGKNITVCMFRLRRLEKQPPLPATKPSIGFKSGKVTADKRKLACFRKTEQIKHLKRKDREPGEGPKRDYKELFLEQQQKPKALKAKGAGASKRLKYMYNMKAVAS